ncbi:hypothetical protein BD626DRAFT_476897 [Schizophyllum amplum]|uniref:RING-type domain-containing protein n=1 Tax=Schizophyllum amplum TaxID=97359 RepID=A0A550CZS4_9AGAR|nr:hypothetical protein BD626DRAFT_476897 [Auriculariopsis ampla]
MLSASCSICLESYKFPEKGLIFPHCGHSFCEACAKRTAAICPMCRKHSGQSPLIRVHVELEENEDALKALASEREQNAKLLKLAEDSVAELRSTRQALRNAEAKLVKSDGVVRKQKEEIRKMEGHVGVMEFTVRCSSGVFG